MDYEKAYKKALERAATELETCGADESLRNMIYAIFPDELKESEDEQTRKGLINFLKSPFIKENICDWKVAPWLAWLEKQKELPECSVRKTVAEAKEAIFDSKDEKIRKAIYNALKYLERQLSWDFLGDVDILDAYDWLEKQGEQKPTWSEEDDAYKLFAISAVEDYYDEKNPLQKDLIEWLKSLKERLGGK